MNITRYDVIASQMQKEMARRYTSCNKQKDHPTKILTVHGEDVPIDENMVPVIKWFNSFPGVSTVFCCQGDVDENNDGKHKKPYVIWRSKDQNVTESIIKMFSDFHWHFATCNVADAYHEIKTIVDYFNGVRHTGWHDKTKVDCFNGMRYTSEWYDNISLKDFITWAKL